ncbi:MAG TPA: ElyC/SanA/YdcF family protein [Actinocrinis sp.]
MSLEQGTAGADQGDPESAEADHAEADTLATTLPDTQLPDTQPDAPVEAAASRRPWRRRSWQRRAFQALCVACVAVFVPISVVRVAGDEYVRSIQDAPAEPVGIVFGAAVDGDDPSPYLASRLDVAIALWRAGKIKVFLVTGDHASAAYDEPQAMRDYLIRHGVPAGLIVEDGAGFDTWQSCARAKQVFGVSRAIVVSQSFHVPRAVFLCRAAGIEAYGVGDGDAAWRISPDEDVHDSLRELAAGFNAVYQGTFTPAPQVSAGPSGAIARALQNAG